MSAWIRKKLKLYLVMGSVNCLMDPREVLEMAITGGITMFQFREKGSMWCGGKKLKKKLEQLIYRR